MSLEADKEKMCRTQAVKGMPQAHRQSVSKMQILEMS